MSWAGVLPFAFLLAVAPACRREISALNMRNQTVAFDQDLEKLRKLVTLPAPPVQVWYEQVPRGASGGLGPSDYLLIVVMRFKPNELASITAHAQRRPGPLPRITSEANRPWIPEPVKSAICPHDDYSVSVRGETFDAADFSKSPFLSGTFTVVEGGEYVVLVMGTS